jgi:hypothetical protein
MGSTGAALSYPAAWLQHARQGFAAACERGAMLDLPPIGTCTLDSQTSCPQSPEEPGGHHQGEVEAWPGTRRPGGRAVRTGRSVG